MMLNTTQPSIAKPVVSAFLNMRIRCQHFTGQGDDWNTTQCRCKGNNHAGSICAMGYCPQLRDEAAEAAVGWN